MPIDKAETTLNLKLRYASPIPSEFRLCVLNGLFMEVPGRGCEMLLIWVVECPWVLPEEVDVDRIIGLN